MAEDLKFNKALFEALNSDNLELAEILLKRGADPNGVLAVEGVAPLHIAAGLGETAVKLLMSYGGDPNVRSADGTTPLHVAATWGDSASLHFLLLNGGDPYVRDQEGVSVIESAANYNHDGCVVLLEYFCLLLNPDEDTVSTAPKYTYQFKGSLSDYGKPKVSQELNESLYLGDFHHSSFKDIWKGDKFYQKEFQKRVDRFGADENVRLDVTSPDHPLIQHRREKSPPDASLHVHWADKLAQTLPHVTTSPDCNTSSDTFITCSGEEQDLQPNKFFTSDLFNSFTNNQSGNDVNISPSSTKVSSDIFSSTTKNKNNSCLNRLQSMCTELNYGHNELPSVSGKINKTCKKESFSRTPVHVWEPSPVVNEVDESLLSSDESFVRRHQGRCEKNKCEDKLNNSDVFDDYNFDEFDSIITEDNNNSTCNILLKKRVSFAEQPDKSTTLCANEGSKSVVNQNVDKTFLMDKLRQSLSSVNSGRSSASSVENDVLNQSFCWPRHSTDSILSDTSTVDYIYTDKEKGVQLIERHLPSLQGSSGRPSLDSVCSFNSINTIDSQQTIIYDWRAFSDTSTCTEDVNDINVNDFHIPSSLRSLDNLQLRDKLRKKGDNPGPVTDQTRQLYLVRLTKINSDPGYLKLCKSPPVYSPELTEALSRYDKTGLADLEEKLISSFANSNRCWREGTLKSSFNYLLLDPRVTKNLPNRMYSLGDVESFKVFVAAIFYVGKGKRSRPYCHLYEAIRQMEKPKPQVCDKVKHILDIWSENVGVVSLHCFQNVIPVEAYTREACIVDAISLNRLTNKKRGDYYGISTTWGMKERRKMGVYFLKKALQIFQGEGERQILPVDIKIGQ